MKKFVLSILALCFGILVYAQPVSDNATIPVSVTLNTILRLNVTSGGNIEFTFNTIDEYTSGVASSARTTTSFTVASSNDYDVALDVEDATFIGNDDVTHTMPLNHVGYTLVDNTGSTTATYTATLQDLADNATFIVAGPAGDVAANDWSIQWEAGTAGTGGGPLLGASVAPDRYSTNVFLILSEN